MATVMTNTEFCKKLKEAATNYKTLYIMGCFGAPMNAKNKTRYSTNYAYNKQASRTAMINAASDDTFGFDCVCLIKGILWGWCGDKSKSYGGAGYAVNGVPDIGADAMITKCADISTDFSNITPGEAVWMTGHIGVYVGDGLAVECTPKWENKVQITACNCTKSGYNRRNWTKHGKLPYVEYVTSTVTETEKPTETVVTQKQAVTFDTLAVGDIVDFNGTLHYTSANGLFGKKTVASKAKVTAKYKSSSRHPVHLRKVDDNGNFVSGGVYGWCNLNDITKTTTVATYSPQVGDTVKLANGAPVYGTTKQFSKWVYSATLYVRSIAGARVVISTLKTGDVTGAVDAKYLTKI